MAKRDHHKSVLPPSGRGVQGSMSRISTPLPSSDMGIDELKRQVKLLGRRAVRRHERWTWGHLAGELTGEEGRCPGAGRVERKFREGDSHQLGAAELVPFSLLFGFDVFDLLEAECGRIAIERPDAGGVDGAPRDLLDAAHAVLGPVGQLLVDDPSEARQRVQEAIRQLAALDLQLEDAS